MPLKYIKQTQPTKLVSSLKTTKRNKPLKKIAIKKTFEPLLNTLGYTIKKLIWII